MLVVPTHQGPGKYVWNDVYVGKSTQMHGGQGLFAKWDLEPGLMFPIAGCRAPPNLENQSHAYAITTSEGKVLINGSPDLYPHGGIGSFGLAVAMMANETVTPDRAPNCQLYNDYLVVFRRTYRGEELLTYYGPQYEETRRKAGYRDSRPAAARELDLDAWRTVRSRLNIPPRQQRQTLLDGVDEQIRLLVRGRADVVPAPSPSRRIWSDPRRLHPPAADQAPPVRGRPTLVLHPWIVYYMCQGLYVWDQRMTRRAFATGRLPMRVNIMSASSTKKIHHRQQYRSQNSVPELVRKLRANFPTPLDELPGDFVTGRVHCTCTADRELSPTEKQEMPIHMQLAGADFTVKMKNFIVFPGNGIEAAIATGGRGVRFHTLTPDTQKQINEMETLAVETFGYDH